MIATRVLLALALVTVGVAVTPAASAAGPCVVGNEDGARPCAVTIHTPVCVTDPCPWRVCVGWGLVCKEF